MIVFCTASTVLQKPMDLGKKETNKIASHEPLLTLLQS